MATPDNMQQHSAWTSTINYTILTDDVISTALYEIELDDKQLVLIQPEVFSAWTGLRFINGTEYHGPVYNIDTNVQYTGPRHCHCRICQMHTLHIHRKN